eukprot:Gb_10964 [translate_table: standard]
MHADEKSRQCAHARLGAKHKEDKHATCKTELHASEVQFRLNYGIELFKQRYMHDHNGGKHQESALHIAKNTGFSKIMVRDIVRLEDEPLANEIMKLRNLNIFLYEEMMKLRTDNKSLMVRMDRIKSIAKNEAKARHRVKHKPQGRSLWKCLNTPYEGNVLEREVRI